VKQENTESHIKTKGQLHFVCYFLRWKESYMYFQF